jgi:phage tail-like protein
MSTIKNAVLWGLVLAGLLAGGSASATNFAIILSGSSVDGSDTILHDCYGVVMEDLTFDSREMTTGLDVEYRRFQPGKPQYGNVTFQAEPGTGASQELLEWYKKVLAGQTERKSGSVILTDRMGQEIMRYTFLDCFLTSYSVVEEQNADGSVRVIEEYEVKPNGVQMYKAKQGKSGKANPGKMSIIEDDGSTSTDDTVEGWSGGEPALIITSPFRNSRFHTETPGNKLVTDISLDLPDDGPSQVICDWVNAAVQGKPWKKSMSMVDLSAKGKPVGKMYHYHECFPMRYVFPSLSKGNTIEAGPTLTIKAARVNIN